MGRAWSVCCTRLPSAMHTPSVLVAHRWGLHTHGVRALRACVQVLMLFEALGESYYEASSNAWALSRVKPVKLITQVSMHAHHHQPCMLR